jgi:hypothetical protein
MAEGQRDEEARRWFLQRENPEWCDLYDEGAS